MPAPGADKDPLDEILDGLRVKEDTGYYDDEEVITEDYRPPRIRMPRWIAFCVPLFCFIMGAVFGLSAYPEDSSDGRPSLPEPARTVTTTTTQPAIPASCAWAIRTMQRIEADVSTIGAAGEEQLDISHAARQAIFLKDWKALDAAMKKQTDLNNRLDKPATEAMRVTLELQKAMQECLDATK